MRFRPLGVIVAVTIAMGALAFPSAGPARAGSTCTGWTSYLRPPTSIRVYRTKTRRTETVPFRTYVERVMASEWGATNPRAALEMGALAVKQYAWYYAMHWRGGRDAAGRCYDVRDSSSDQVYNPARTVAASHRDAVAATWGISLRKGDRFFLTGYRAGTGSCTAHIDGSKLYQRDATDCVRRYGDTAEKLARRFFSSVSWITPGIGDSSGDQRGDMIAVAIDPGTGDATATVYTSDRTYRAAATAGSRLGVAVSTVSEDRILGRAAGDVTGDGRRDIVQLVSSGDGFALQVLGATSTGFRAASTWWRRTDLAPAGADDVEYRLVVSDFTGDGVDDAGIVQIVRGETPSTSLFVGRSNGSDISSSAKAWSIAADLSTSEILAGDLSGDALGDLLVLTPTSTGHTAIRVARMGTSGKLGSLVTRATESLPQRSLRSLLGDVNRDGRDDLILVRRSGTGSRVIAYRSGTMASSFSPIGLTSTLTLPFDATRWSTSDVNADGLADLYALVDRGVDGDGTSRGTAITRLLSPRRGTTLEVRPWMSVPSMDWASTFPY